MKNINKYLAAATAALALITIGLTATTAILANKLTKCDDFRKNQSSEPGTVPNNPGTVPSLNMGTVPSEEEEDDE